MRALLSTLVFTFACAPAPRPAWPAAATELSCWWRDVRWEDRAPLLVPGTTKPLGRARVAGAAEGARFSGALVRGAGGPVLRGTWAGAGLGLLADVDVGAHAALRAWAPARVGGAGFLPAGAGLLVLDSWEDRLLVAPANGRHHVFEAVGVTAMEVACDGVSLLRREAPAPLRGEAAWLPRGRRVDATGSPGGTPVGTFVAPVGPVRGVVLERREDLVRFAADDEAGARWVAWVPAEALELGPPPAGEAFDEAPAPPAPPRALRSCGTGLELRALVAGEGGAAVGTLAPGTPFSVGRAVSGGVAVTPAVSWLELAEGVELVLPAEAAQCPARVAPPTSP